MKREVKIDAIIPDALREFSPSYRIDSLFRVQCCRHLAILILVAICCGAGLIRNSAWTNEETLWKDSIDKNPGKARAYACLAVAYGEQRHPGLALKCYAKAIEIEPHDALTFYNRGRVYFDRGQYERAIDDFTEAIHLNSKYAPAYNNLGNAYFEEGYIQRSIDFFSKAIDLDPQFAGAYNNRGNAYLARGQYEESMADYNAAIAIDPDYADAYVNRGKAHGYLGRDEMACADFCKAECLKTRKTTDPLIAKITRAAMQSR